MKKLLLLLLMTARLFAQVQPTQPSQGLFNGNVFANGYANWSVPMGLNGSFSWTESSFCTANSGGTSFPAFTVGTPITILDQITPTHNEVVTVTAVNIFATGCSIVTTPPTFTHTQFSLTTATGGLQEAINANLKTSVNTTVHLTADWYRAGGQISQVTTSIVGNTLIGIVDDTQAPNNYYTWNGSHYVLSTVNGTQLATYNVPGLQGGGRCFVYPSSITSDAFAAINACSAQLPAAGGLIDATALGTANYTVTTQLTALNNASQAVTLLLNSGTMFTINTSFDTPTDSPASCAVPVGGPLRQGSAIIVPGHNAFGGNFLVGPSAKVWDVVCSGAFTGTTQESLALDGVTVQGNSASTVMGALIHLQGVFVPTHVDNSGTYQCFAQCLEIDAGTTQTAIGQMTFYNDVFTDGYSGSQTYPGSVVRIDALTSAGEATNLTFIGGVIQDNGPHNQLLMINGRGGVQTNSIQFLGTSFQTAAATTSTFNSNVDPIQLVDAAQVLFGNLHVQGALNSAAQANMVDISATTAGTSYGININQVTALTAAGFTCLIHNTIEGTCETGFANGNGDTVLPDYTYGQVVPQVRMTNTAPPSTVGQCIVGSTWYNSSGTTPSTVAFVCAGAPGAQTYQAFGGGGGGGGPLGTLPYDVPTNNASNTAAIGSFNFQATALNAPQSAVNAAAANNGTVTIQPAAGRAVFANTGNVHVTDNRTDVPADARKATEFGVAGDARVVYGTLAASSATLTITSGTLTANDVGRTIVAVGSVSSVPTAFESKILTFTDSLHAVLTTASPFTQSTAHAIIIGHDDSAAVTQGLNAVGSGGTLVFPEGTVLMHTQVLKGQSIIGLGPNSQIELFPCEDGFAAPDPSLTAGVSQGPAHIHDLTFLVDQRCDATQPWQIVNDSGTTAKAALYRPIAQKSGVSPDPLAPGWFQGGGPNLSGAINGVCAINSGSPTLCTVPAGPPLPVATNTIVFPYLSTVFTTTVASVNTGTRVVTLTGSYPGTTASQIEWFAGTSVQNLSTSIGSGACPSTITLANSINPVAGFESNVAPYGLIQIDAEQFTYFGKSNASNPTPANTLYGIQCAQNGTSRAAHSSAATVVPLNQWQPTYPWPVTPTINSGASTPSATAGYYPGANVGNAVFAFPVTNGSSTSGTLGGWGANSKVENLSFYYWPNEINGEQWEGVNHSADFYFVQPPYATKFQNISSLYVFYGPQMGPPSISNGNYEAAQPTADGSSWDQIAIWAAYPFSIPLGNQNAFTNFNVYSQESTTSGTGLGADTCFLFTQEWNDQTGGIAQALTLDTMHNLYCEPEGGPHAALMPHWEFDTFNSQISGIHMGGGGEVYIGGATQHFQGGNFNQSPGAPAINFGPLNSSDYVSGLGNEPKGNVYGTNSLINFGPSSKFSGQTSQAFGSFNGPFGALQVGNNREPIASQTNECFDTGNAATCYPSSGGGYITPEEFNTSFSFEIHPLTQGWTFDATSPITDAYGACTVGTSATTVYCGSAFFNEEGISIGPGQRLVPGKYTLWISMKDATQASNTENMTVYSNCGGVSSTFTIPITNAWPTQPFSTPIDLTGGGGNACFIGIQFKGATTGDSIQFGYFDFAPVWQQPTAYNLNVQNQIIDPTGSTGTANEVWTSGGSSAPNFWGPGAGITALTGDVNASGTGSVAATVQRIGGGTLFSGFTGLLQNTAGVVTQAQSFALTGPGQVGTYLRSGVNTVTFSATPVFDLSLGDTQTILLTGNVTSSTFANLPATGYKQRVDFLVCQDGTGGRTFIPPVAIQGWTPVTQVANGCTSEFFNVTTTSAGTTITADNYNGENCISSASPAVCDQATQGEIAIPTGTNPTLQINTAAWNAHSKLLFTPDQTKASDLGITCNTALPTGRYEVTGGSSGVDVILTWVGTISGNPLCGTFTVVNP